MNPDLLPVAVGATIVIDAPVDAEAEARQGGVADCRLPVTPPCFGSCRYPFPLVLGVSRLLGLLSPGSTSFLLLGCTTAHHETRRSRSESRELVSRHPQCRVKYGKLPTTPTASISHSHSSTLSRVEVRPQKTSSTFLKLPSLFRQYIVELRRIGSNESICADTFCINLMANPAY